MTIDSKIEPEHQYWQWQDWKIHFVQQGDRGPCVLLIHGFGASTDHWRKNIEKLSKTCRVWAIDLLGFGRSQKPKAIYSGELWRDQLTAFCQQIIQEPVFVAGNSLGGYSALCFAADHPEWVRGLMLLNCAGPFTTTTSPQTSTFRYYKTQLIKVFFKLPGVIETLSAISFLYFRRRSQIRKVLLQVYKDPTTVTDRLVEEIYQPAFDAGALGVFASVFKSPQGRKLDQLLEALTQPLILIWGEADPWMSVDKAKKFRDFSPKADITYIDAGHCPQDENPEAVNVAMLNWIQQQCSATLNPSTA